MPVFAPHEFGKVPRAEDLVITHERGQLVRHLKEILQRDLGDGAWEVLLSRVSEPCRQAFSGDVGVFEWVDAALAAELSLAYSEASADRLTLERGREAAREQLTTVNRWMLRFLSPTFLLSNLSRFFRFYFKGGLLQVEHEGANTATLHIWAIGLYPAYWRSGVTGWLEEALGMTGAREIQVQFEAPEAPEGIESHHYRYHLSWL